MREGSVIELPRVVTLHLPMPASVNRIWRHAGKRVVRSAEYRQWQEQADAFVMSTRAQVERIPGRFEIEIVLDDRCRAGDLDNRLKAVLDYCERATIIADDKHCQRITASWGPTEHGCRVRVWPAQDIEPLDLQLEPAEIQMMDRAFERWSVECGLTVDELQDRLR